MASLTLLMGFLLVGGFSADVEAESKPAWARKILHKDGKTTVAKKTGDTLEESTFNSHSILVAKRTFQMDRKGRIRAGLILDGKSNILGRTAYGFDKYDRIQEERMFNARGEVTRRLIYRYKPDGTMEKPIAFTYDPKRPTAAPRRSVGEEEPMIPHSAAEPDYPGIPIRPPSSTVIGSQPLGGASTMSGGTPVKPAKKKGFLRNLGRKLGIGARQ